MQVNLAHEAVDQARKFTGEYGENYEWKEDFHSAAGRSSRISIDMEGCVEQADLASQ